MSFFDGLELVPGDPLFAIPPLYAADKRPNKVDLSLGVYHDDNGRPTVLECVRLAEKEIVERQLDKKYLPMDGHDQFIDRTLKLIFGEDASRQSICAAQTVGGTGALRVAGTLLKILDTNSIYISDPSWANHTLIFSKAGLEVKKYPYYSASKQAAKFDEMCQTLQKLPPNSVLLLQNSCHNPTGVDLAFEQWQEISKLIQKHHHLPFFDFAYQGFGGTLEEDASVIRYFREQGHEMLLAYSFSKNLGLYGERVGLLAAIADSADTRTRIQSQIKQIIRSLYSTPPLFGARTALTIFDSDPLRKLWLQELKTMRERIQDVRKSLAEGLNVEMGDPGAFSFLQKQKGLFSFCGLTEEQTALLREKYAIFMPASGRINMAALNPHNISYVIKSFSATLKA